MKSANEGGGVPDFRRFVFKATGEETDPAHLSPVDVYDNLRCELDRLAAIAEALSCAGSDFDPDKVEGIGWLIKDIHDRMLEVVKGLVKDEADQ